MLFFPLVRESGLRLRQRFLQGRERFFIRPIALTELLQLARKRFMHGAQARLFALHVAQAAHLMDHARLGFLCLGLQRGKLRLTRLQRAFALRQRLRRLHNGRLLLLRARVQRFYALLHAFLAFACRGNLAFQPLAFAPGIRHALPHHQHRAFARFHFANQPLHLFALGGGALFQFAQRLLHIPAFARQIRLCLRRLCGKRAEFLRLRPEFFDARVQPLGFHQENVQIQPFQFIAQFQIFPRRFGLLAQRLNPRVHFAQNVLHARKVHARVLHAALGLVAPGTVFHNTRRFFKNLAAVFALGRKDFIHTALPHQRIPVPTHASVPEQVDHVFQAASGAIDRIFALARAVHAPGNGHFLVFDGQ